MTPQDLINDLNRIDPFKDNRVLIWYCNLYVEHFIKLIYKKHVENIKFNSCSECKKSLEPSFLTKVRELSIANFIDTENIHDKFIEMIYRSRNKAGHELIFQEPKVIEIIEKTLSNAKMEDPDGLITKLLRNITTWKKLEISTVAVVSKLYQSFEQMNDRVLENRLIYEINQECTEVLPKIISVDDFRW